MAPFTGYDLAEFSGLRWSPDITASLERLILYRNPILVLLLGRPMYGGRIRRPQPVAMVVSDSGLVLRFGLELTLDGQRRAGGVLLVFLRTISDALYMSYSGELVDCLGALCLAGLATSVACLLCIAQFALSRPLSAAQVAPPGSLAVPAEATACTALPVVLVMMAIERIGPALTAQTGMIGPMSTILMGVLILGEPLNSWVIAGTVLVVAGIYMFSRSARQA